MAGIEDAFEKFVKKISDIEEKDTEDNSNFDFGKNVYAPQDGLFFSPVQKNQIPFGDILKSDQRLNPPIPTPTQRNLSSEERMRLEDNEYFMSQGKPQYVSPVVQGQGFNKKDLKDFTKQYLQSQTSLGGGIGYQGPEYGLVAIKPFVGPDRSALLQAYYNTDNEGSRIQAGLSPKEQRIDYTGNTGTTFSAGRNTYQGNPYYTFNVNKPFADGGVASMFRERPGYAEGGTEQSVQYPRIPEDQDYNAMNEYYTLLEQLSQTPDSSRTAAVRESLLNDLKNVETLKNTNPNYNTPVDFVSNTNLKLSLLDNLQKPQTNSGTYPSFIDGPNGIKFELVTGRFSGKPVYKAKYPEDYDFSKGAIGGSTATEFDPEQIFRDVMTTGTSTSTTTEIPKVDPFSGEQVSAQDQSSFANVGGISPEDFLKENPGYVVTNLTDIAGVPRFNAYKPEVPTVDPFSGQQVSDQDQTVFTQPQAEIFPQQPSPIEQFKAERQFQSEADAAARSGIPFTKTIQNYLGNLYSGPEIANMQEQTFGTSNLSGDTGIVSDLRHATAASQVRDKIADAVSMGYFNPAGILPQSLGLFGSQVLGAANEIQSIRPNMQSMRDIGEDLRANFYGATQVPYGQSATTTYNQLLNNPSLPSAQMRSQQEASARVTPRMAYGGRVSMSDGGLTTTVPPDKGPDSQGVESLFRRRYS